MIYLNEALAHGRPDTVEFGPMYEAWACWKCGALNERFTAEPTTRPSICEACGAATALPDAGQLTVTHVDHERRTITISGGS